MNLGAVYFLVLLAFFVGVLVGDWHADKHREGVKRLDLKSLEYIENRANKGRALLNEIEYLLKCVEEVGKAENVSFESLPNGVNFYVKDSYMLELKRAFIEQAIQEVKQLQNEFISL